MIKIHLNGDIVRCPDTVNILARSRIRKVESGYCQYNIYKLHCDVYRKHGPVEFDGFKEHTQYECPLVKSYLCPLRQKQLEHGRKQKHFRMNNVHYRTIASAVHYMLKEGKHKTIFFTLSLGEFKNKQNETDKKLFESNVNKAFSRFMENLHNNYGIKYYVATRECGENNGRLHYHVLVNCKFIDFTDLNTAWNHALQDICYASPCSFRTRKGKVILWNPAGALRYICKYVSKSRGQISETRIIFMSMPCIIKSRELKYDIRDMLDTYKSVTILQTSDFTTSFRITDPTEFAQFCNLFLYNLFDLRNKKHDFTPLNTSYS